jgi:phosphopantothenoylcysteine decarboxylase/phosphopantothenate--cysteine ligase
MNCIVTAGPTYEKLDQVRRLTNFSSGRLGTELANYLTDQGHAVTMLIGEEANYSGKRNAERVETFTTTEDLHDRLQAESGPSVHGVFHAAAVSDFTFGRIFTRSPQGKLIAVKSGKLSTRQGTLLAELTPTPKIIASLRSWFPQAKLIGWKYEVDGDRDTVLVAAQKQLQECLTDMCVANGPAYGAGFGLVASNGKNRHVPGAAKLFEALEKMLRQPAAVSRDDSALSR